LSRSESRRGWAVSPRGRRCGRGMGGRRGRGWGRQRRTLVAYKKLGLAGRGGWAIGGGSRSTAPAPARAGESARRLGVNAIALLLPPPTPSPTASCRPDVVPGPRRDFTAPCGAAGDAAEIFSPALMMVACQEPPPAPSTFSTPYPPSPGLGPRAATLPAASLSRARDHRPVATVGLRPPAAAHSLPDTPSLAHRQEAGRHFRSIRVGFPALRSRPHVRVPLH